MGESIMTTHASPDGEEEVAMHDPYCSCKPEQVFRCDKCAGLFGWCLGCYDDDPETCDLCFFLIR